MSYKRPNPEYIVILDVSDEFIHTREIPRSGTILKNVCVKVHFKYSKGTSQKYEVIADLEKEKILQAKNLDGKEILVLNDTRPILINKIKTFIQENKIETI